MADDYLKLLRDPRWQRRRLEIMKRDHWRCQECFRGDVTLTVHHRWYEGRRDPWDYPDEALVTLCDPCHEHATDLLRRLRRAAGAMAHDELSDLVVQLEERKRCPACGASCTGGFTMCQALEDACNGDESARARLLPSVAAWSVGIHADRRDLGRLRPVGSPPDRSVDHAPALGDEGER